MQEKKRRKQGEEIKEINAKMSLNSYATLKNTSDGVLEAFNETNLKLRQKKESANMMKTLNSRKSQMQRTQPSFDKSVKGTLSSVAAGNMPFNEIEEVENSEFVDLLARPCMNRPGTQTQAFRNPLNLQ